MSKRHYEAIAAILRLSDEKIRDAFARDLAIYFASENPRFNPKTFFKAAGVTP